MKSLVLILFVAVWIANGCASDETGFDGPDNCLSDSCLCPSTETCDHACSPGGLPCHVLCSPGLNCNVICDPTEECHVGASQAAHVDIDCNGTFECHVDASQAADVDIDCNGTPECHVACPSTGCTVTNCIGDCAVICGLTAIATHHGSTATCP